MKKIKKALLAVSLMVVGGAALSFGACGSEKDTVKYTFNTNGGNAISVEELKVGEEFTLPIPEREGYSFEGWYLTEDFSGSAVTTVKAEKSQTYYAKWEKLSVLTLDVNGGTLAETTLYVKAGANVYDALANIVPTKEGYVFGAWFNGEIALAKNTRMPENGLTLTAKYKVAYTVEIWQEKMTDDGGDKYEKSSETLVEYDYVGTKIEANYKFTGFTEVEHDNAIYETTLKDNASENVLRLYFDRETYTLTFTPNYPAGKQGEDVVHTVKYGTEIEVPSGYTMKGYCLVGWATSSNGEVAYNVGSLDLYNSDEEPTESDKVMPDRNTTLYGIWEKGYLDMFGGADYIYRFDNEPNKVYLWRGDDVNGKYFVGEYYSDSTFEFIDENEDLLLEGRIYDNGTFAYRSAERNGSVATLYDLATGEFIESTTILFDAYDGITYIVKDEEGKTTSSEGTYVINEEGFYEVNFYEGEMAGQKASLLVSYISLEDGTQKSAFLVRNDAERAMGELVRFGIYQGKITYYTAGQIEFDGFGRVAYKTQQGTQTYYCALEGDKLTIKNPDGSVGLVAYIMDLEIYDGTTKKGYMVYDENLAKTFTLESGAKLTLDGMYQATYVTGGKTVSGYYGVEQSIVGKTIYAIQDGDKTYKFEVTQTTVSVPVEGGEEGETTFATTYSFRELLEGYTEMFAFVGFGVQYAPILVLNDVVEGDAALYGMGSSSDHAYQKISSGTYFYNEEKDEYVYSATEFFDAKIIKLPNAVDIKKTQAATFKIAENYAVGVSYWIKADLAEDGEEDLAEIYTSANGDGSTLTCFSEYAIYAAADGNVIVAGIYSSTLFSSQISDPFGVTVYLELNHTDKTFEVLDYASYTQRLVDEALKPLETEYILFDGKGGAHYTIVTMDGEERIYTTYSGTSVESGETFNGNVIYNYTGELDGKSITFRYIVVNNYILRECIDYETVYNCEDGLLELDGFRLAAKYTDKEGTSVLGSYAITRDGEKVEISFTKTDKSVMYFDFANYATDKNFTIRGQEYGTYIVVDNQVETKLTVDFDGYGNAIVYSGEELTEVDDSAIYEMVDGEITITYHDGNQTVKLIGGKGSLQKDGKIQLTFLLSHKEIQRTFVNEDDWSLLVLDDLGSAVKYNQYGMGELGYYILITEDLLYYVSSSGDNSIYKYDVEAGTATPIKFTERGYYTETLESLAFTKSGFAIFNGVDEYFYNMDGDNVIIYRLAEDGETEGVNEYGYVSENFGTFDQEKKWTTNGEEKTYYLSMSHKLTFERKEEGKEKYPVLVTEDKYAALENISFTPSGETEFIVRAKVLIDGHSYDGYAVREIDEETGKTSLYVTVGYYRFDIEVTYTGDRLDGSNNNTYEITNMSYRMTLPSYTYLRVIWFAYLFGGAEYAINRPNDYGEIYINREYNEAGEEVRSYITGWFGEKQAAYDSTGTLLEINEDSVYETIEDIGTERVEWTGADGYTYALYFGFMQHDYLRAYGYYTVGLVRVQEFTTENGYTVKVERIISSDESEGAAGSVFSIKLIDGENEVDIDTLFTIGDKVYVVERTEDEEGNVTNTTYYKLTFTDVILETEEPELPEEGTGGSLPGEGEEDGGDDKEKINPVAPYASVVVEKQENVTVVYEGDNFAEITEEGVMLVYLDGTFYATISCTYDEATQTYSIKMNDGSSYTLKLVGEGQMQLTKVEETEE